MSDSESDTSSLELVSKIVSAYVSENTLPSGELPQLIKTVHEALINPGQAAASPLEPAVPIKKSIKPDYVICLEDGRKLKMLKRHLRTAYDTAQWARYFVPCAFRRLFQQPRLKADLQPCPRHVCSAPTFGREKHPRRTSRSEPKCSKVLADAAAAHRHALKTSGGQSHPDAVCWQLPAGVS
jgi:hypothetical protein